MAGNDNQGNDNGNKNGNDNEGNDNGNRNGMLLTITSYS